MKKPWFALIPILFGIIFSTQNSFAQNKEAMAGQNIPCPVQEIRAEITTALPSPWWNTPQVGGVVNTHVETVGGNRVLMCEYQAYGRTVPVMRQFPPGTTNCTPQGNGFVCQ